MSVDTTIKPRRSERRIDALERMCEETIAFVIGIDPGQTTGMAAYDRRTKKIRYAASGSFWDVFEAVQELPADCTRVVIEDPGLNPTTFGHGEYNPRKREKISRNVGKNQRDAELLIAGLRRIGYDVVPVRPTKGTGSKMTKAQVKRITGYDQAPNNQHIRDAIMLAWGR